MLLWRGIKKSQMLNFLVIPLLLTMQEYLVSSILRTCVEMAEKFVGVLIFVRFLQVMICVPTS